MLRAAGYDAEHLVFRALFRNGRIYDYLDVSPRHWQALLSASSKGRYFNFNIRSRHRYRRRR